MAPGPRSASCSRGSRGDVMGMTTDHCLTGVPAGRHPSMGVGTSGPVGVAPGPRLAFCTREPRGVHPQSSCLRLGLPLPLVTTGHPLGCRRQPGEKVYPPLLSPTVVSRSHHMDLPLMIQRLGRGYSTSACLWASPTYPANVPRKRTSWGRNVVCSNGTRGATPGTWPAPPCTREPRGHLD